MRNLIYPTLLFLCLLFSCDIKEIDQELVICGSGDAQPTLEEFFKCGEYQTIEIETRTFFDGELMEKEEPMPNLDYQLITLTKGNLLFGLVISAAYESVFSPFQADLEANKTAKNQDVVKSADIGSFAFFQKKIEDFERSSDACRSKGLITTKYNFEAKTAGKLTSCEMDLNICYNDKSYRVLHDKWPFDDMQ